MKRIPVSAWVSAHAVLLPLFVSAVFTLLLARPCRAEAPQPFQLMRALGALQNEAALGGALARNAQSALVSDIAAEFLRTPAEAWRERRNAQAAILFLLSGGPAASVRPALASVAAPDHALVKGALAFAEGREAEARRLLLPRDALLERSPIGGPLALTQAALVMHDEPKRALTLLDQARLLSPGTLIEEAALRRTAFIADEIGDTVRFLTAVTRYRRRFPKSAYAAGIEKRLVPAAIRSVETNAPEAEDFLNLLDAGARLDLRLQAARKAIVRGDLDRARRLAEAAAIEARAGSVEAARAALYRAASDLKTEAAEAELLTIDAARLPPDDAQLLAATLSVVRQIRAELPLHQTAVRTDVPTVAEGPRAEP